MCSMTTPEPAFEERVSAWVEASVAGPGAAGLAFSHLSPVSLHLPSALLKAATLELP